MMRTILIVVCLLLSTAPASAECAWVLWERELPPLTGDVSKDFGAPTLSRISWAPQESFKSIEACKAKESKADTRYNPDTKKLKPIPGGHTICLPDTVDPRGPKASGR
jgi:hypothetical protein